MLPTVGRIVHWEPLVGDTPGPMAAIVTAVHNDSTVDLAIFWPGSSAALAMTHVANADEPTAGHWNWPPRAGA